MLTCRAVRAAELRTALHSGKYIKLAVHEGALLASDRFLLKFLRSRKFRVKEARKLLVSFFKWRREKPQYFEQLDVAGPAMQRILHAGSMLLAPGVDALGRRVRVVNLAAFSRQFMDRDDALDGCSMVRYAVMMTLLLSEDAYLAVHGVVVLFNATDMGLGRMLRWRSAMAASHNDMITMEQKVLPVRLKGIYFVHQPRLFSVVYAIVKHVLSAKIRERVRLYGSDLERLRHDVPPHVLPESLGGTLSTEHAIANTSEAARQSLATAFRLAGIEALVE